MQRLDSDLKTRVLLVSSEDYARTCSYTRPVVWAIVHQRACTSALCLPALDSELAIALERGQGFGGIPQLGHSAGMNDSRWSQRELLMKKEDEKMEVYSYIQWH